MDRQIALTSRDALALQGATEPSLGVLRAGLMMLFCGLMLTLSVTLSLAGQFPQRDAVPMEAASGVPTDTTRDSTTDAMIVSAADGAVADRSPPRR